MYIDAHCHLERETYGDELDEVIANRHLLIDELKEHRPKLGIY